MNEPEPFQSAPGAAAASWWTSAVAFLGGIGGGVVFPILPTLGLRLGLSAALVGLILAANRITRIGFNPVTGALVDRFGGKGPVTAGLVIETGAIAMFVLALHARLPGLWFLGGRVVWGVGSSLLIVGAMAAVLAISGHGDRGRLVGRVRMSMSLGLPGGLLLGGVLADAASPRTAFVTAAAVTAVAALLALWGVPARARRPDDDAAPGRSGLGVWKALWHERALRVIWIYNLLVFLTVQGVLLSTVVLLIAARGLFVPGLHEQGSAGLLMAVLMVFRGIASISVGRWLDRSASRTGPLLLALAAMVGGFAGLALARDLVTAMVSLLAIGAGTGALTIPLLALLGDVTDQAERGRALAGYQVFGDIGGSIGPIVGLQLAATTGFAALYAGLAVVLAASLPLVRWLRRRERDAAGNAA
ncbi:MAG TPA: MFS transporter [Gammaproteobacteria bacterium]|nr:MFS transporter [Gammaproteobacteria bacterium]